MTEQQALAIALAAEAAGNQAAMAMNCDSGDFQIVVNYRTPAKPEFVEVTFASSARPSVEGVKPTRVIRANLAEDDALPDDVDLDEHPLVIGEDLIFVTPAPIEEMDK